MVPLYFLLSMILLFGALLYIAGDLRARPTVACSGTRTHARAHARPTPRPAATRRTHRPQHTTAAHHRSTPRSNGARLSHAHAMPCPAAATHDRGAIGL